MNKEEIKKLFKTLDKRIMVQQAIKEPPSPDLDNLIKLSVAYEDLEKENNRLLELCMYALISSTNIYNHELANNTKKAFIDIIKNNLEDDTHTLREKIKNKWEHM